MKNLKLLMSSVVIAITIFTTQHTMGMEYQEMNTFHADVTELRKPMRDRIEGIIVTLNENYPPWEEATSAAIKTGATGGNRPRVTILCDMREGLSSYMAAVQRARNILDITDERSIVDGGGRLLAIHTINRLATKAGNGLWCDAVVGRKGRVVPTVSVSDLSSIRTAMSTSRFEHDYLIDALNRVIRRLPTTQ